MSAPRILFYAVNGLGLGHVTRLLAIARALRRQAAHAEILFLTSSEADSVIFREGFAAVKLPSKTIRETCGLKKSTYLKMAQSVSWNTIASFDPDVLVVDTYPSGSFEELVPVLRWRQKNVFVFREQRRDTFQSALLTATLPLYDLLIVPHDDVDQVGELPEPHKARAVGPILIRERDELLDRTRARRVLGLGERAQETTAANALIGLNGSQGSQGSGGSNGSSQSTSRLDDPNDTLLFYGSFGGGGEPEAARALDLTARAVRALGNAHLVVGAGPLMRVLPAAQAGVTVLAGRYPMLDVLPAFDGAIAAAGYNTVHELLFAGVASTLIPFPRVLDDQERRARELADAGACLLCEPLTEAGLRDSLARLADRTTRQAIAGRARTLVRNNGAGAAAQAILELA